MKPPVNDLERAYVSIRGPESYPAVLRLLLDSNLIFLIPYHPEFEDATIKLKEGDLLPKFVIWKSSGKEGNRIPIFTSVERANDSCKKMKIRDGTYHLMEMRGQELFNILTLQPTPVVINPMSDFSSMFMGLHEIKGLADGSIFRPKTDGVQRKAIATVVPPADYPTDFIQPLFRFLRDRSEIKAVWLLRQTKGEATKEFVYVFLLKAVGDTKRVQEDFFAAARIACPKNVAFNMTFLDETNASIVKMISTHTPFYAAPDYKTPSPLGE